MRILFVLENYIPHIGGVEIVFKNLCEGLVRKGHEVDIVTHRVKGTKKFEIVNGVNVHRIDCFHNRYFFTFFSVPKVFSLSKNTDLIHTTTFNAAFPSWFASKLRRKKCIITVHEVWLGKWEEVAEMSKVKVLFHNFLEKLIYVLSFNKYVAVSDSTRRQLLDIGKNENKCVTIHNGVDYDIWSPDKYDREKFRKKMKIENDVFVYTFTGRPGVSKGLEYLINAIPEISKDILNSLFVGIISKDSAYKKRYDYIMKLIEDLDINDKVMILSPVAYKELPNYIIMSDCVVVPSLSEGFGFAVVEACSLGVPVVASNTTSIPEVISGNFVLAKIKDSNSIAKGVIKVYNKKTNFKKLKRFTNENNINNYLKIYDEVLKSK